ncbi:hypothetical protein COLU111180_18955 [Cohnella lubricantis]|uniref:Uncharacterized protein n=1 Tax=Cohnella lubricantis TaxID=2163172 RepID=A0A841THV8_9BACL|nr:hypothetical protein [Cohnella lubricantis]MBB6678051.1 hypothetical protein [Cohnella lubricantis]MBP2120028.1 hypothetical protein [Cohnella lubricantis]
MRYTVQYIPLSKIKPGLSVQLTKRMKELRRTARDCMHLMVVRKSRKQGGYVLVSGSSHYEFLKKHSRKAAAPCLIDESKASAHFASLVHRVRKRKLPYEVPYLKREHTPASSWAIIRRFLKQEPRFQHLSRRQQLRVLRLGLQYKRTTVSSMKAMVYELLSNK